MDYKSLIQMIMASNNKSMLIIIMKKVTPFFLVSFSIFSFIFSNSSSWWEWYTSLLFPNYLIKFNFSSLPIQLLSHALDKTWIFLICNGIVVVIATNINISSSSSSGSSTAPPSGFEHLNKNGDNMMMMPMQPQLLYPKGNSLELHEESEHNNVEEDDIESQQPRYLGPFCNYESDGIHNIFAVPKGIFQFDYEYLSPSLHTDLYPRPYLMWDEVSTHVIEKEQEQEHNSSSSSLISIDEQHAGQENEFIVKEGEKEEEKEVELSCIMEDNHHEEESAETCLIMMTEEDDEDEEEELYDYEEEEGGGILEKLSTEELNKKFDDFIRKMKEELRIEAQQQQHLLLSC